MMITTITQSAAAASATARVGGIKIAGAVGAEMTEAENGKMVCRLRNSNCVGDVGTDFYLITTAKGNNAHHAGLFFCTLSCEALARTRPPRPPSFLGAFSPHACFAAIEAKAGPHK